MKTLPPNSRLPIKRQISNGSNFSDEDGESGIVVQDTQVKQIVAVGNRHSTVQSQKSLVDSNATPTIKSSSSTPLEDLIRRKNELELKDGASSMCSKMQLSSRVSRRSPGRSPQ